MYVIDIIGFFGVLLAPEIVGNLTVCGFGAGRWYKILTVRGEGRTRFLAGCCYYVTVWRRGSIVFLSRSSR